MNRERAAKATSLRNLALQYERGELDADFAAAEAPIADLRATVARRLREAAGAIESPEA